MDPGLLVGTTDDEILRCYLDLVRKWRGTKGRAPLPLRHADVAVLVSILGTDDAEVERRLIAATACSPRAARRGRLLLFASVSALSLGLTGAAVAGAVTPTHRTAPAAPSHAVAATSTYAAETLEVAETAQMADMAETADMAEMADMADTTTSNTGTVASAPATTTPAMPVTPDAVAPTTAAPTTTAAVARADQSATVAIPSLGLGLPVVDGGQAVIDQGVVAHFWAPGWEPPVAAGGVGTYWLAAHHLSHGAPFGNLPDIAVGAEIKITSKGRTFVYTVTSTEVVGLLPGDAAVYGTDPSASVILLQTCVDETNRFLVHGTLTATE